MCGRSFKHLRSNAVAYLALFIAMGGTSYAAVSLPNNSVGAKQLKKNAVAGTKIKKNAITATKLKKNAITAAKIRASAVDTTKVKDGTLLLRDFAPGQLGAQRVGTGATGADSTGGTNGIGGGGGSGGVNGAAGTAGAAGSNGTAGTNGAAGIRGETGPKGDTGAKGDTGVAGTNGTNGTNGGWDVRVRVGSTGGPSVAIQCALDERAIGGGGFGDNDAELRASVPINRSGAQIDGNSLDTIPTGWKVVLSFTLSSTVHVICAKQ